MKTETKKSYSNYKMIFAIFAILMVISTISYVIFKGPMVVSYNGSDTISNVSSGLHPAVTLCDSTNVKIVTLKELKSTDLYTKNCKFCHGGDGTGNGVKARLNPEICPYDLSKENKPDKFVYYVILNGQEKMPSHEQKLSDENIRVLIVYIKKFKK